MVKNSTYVYGLIHGKGERWTWIVVQIPRVANEWCKSNNIENGLDIKAESNISK